MKLYEQLVSAEPSRNIAFVAVERLTDAAQVREFYEQYVKALAEKGYGREVAAGNIGYVVGYYDRETADRWMSAIGEISHPVFGRSIPWNDPAAAMSAAK